MQPAESYRQAVKALEILGGQPSANRIATWENAGFLRLVGEVFNSAECRSFSDSTLGDLANQKRYSHLLETLIALEANQWNLKSAARNLFVHYNTLKYRYRQIEQILGKSLDCQENRLNLSIALRLKNLSKA
jgi:purine catabolism regulator